MVHVLVGRFLNFAESISIFLSKYNVGPRMIHDKHSTVILSRKSIHCGIGSRCKFNGIMIINL